MTFQIQTEKGKVKITADFHISRKLIGEIEDTIRKRVEERDMPDAVQKMIRKKIPWAGTPRGAIVAYKEARGWNQQELSKKSGIPQANLSKMLNGKLPIGLTVAKKLAKAFGVDYKKFV